MSKIVIVGPDTEMEKTIKALHKMNIMHIVDHKKDDLDIGQPLENAEKLSEILVKTRSLVSQLDIKESPDPEKLKELRKRKLGIFKLEKETTTIDTEISNILEELRTTNTDIKNKEDLIKKLELLKLLNLTADAYSGYKTLDNFTGYIKNLEDFSEVLKKITTKYHIKNHETNKKQLITLFVEKNKSKEVQDLLNMHQFIPIETTQISELKGDITTHLSKINNELDSLIKKEIRLQKSLQKSKKQN